MTKGNLEKILWKRLRAKRFHHHKFRRQVPIGPYIVDFLCVGAAIVIEIDGDSHWEEGAQEYDACRTAFLQKHGFRVVRFTNTQVHTHIDWVLEMIYDAVMHEAPGDE